MRLSASQISCIMRCPREWSWKYLDKKKEPPSKALEFGKAFHQVLDGERPNLVQLMAFDNDYPWQAALDVMVKSYNEAFPKELYLLARELVYEDEGIKAIVDGIGVNEDGSWYIIENKTRSVSLEKIGSLGSDVQISLYHKLAPLFSELCFVDPALYAGIIYTATTKPAQRRSKKESREDFAQRLTSKTDVVVIKPRGVRIDADRYTSFATDAARNASLDYASGNSMSVMCNPASCIRFNNPCPFFDLCHGNNTDISFLHDPEKTEEPAPEAE